MLIKGDTYRDRSHAILTPSRGMIHIDAYQAHLAMLPMPGAKQLRILCAGHEVGRAYDDLFSMAIVHGARYAFTLEDDMLPEPDAISRLFAASEAHPEYDAISALYRTKGASSWPLVIGHPEHPEDRTPRAPRDGELLEVNVIPMGLAIWKLEMFGALDKPWFQTTSGSTQDTFFAIQARRKGFRFAVDCSHKCGHLDITDGEIY